MDQTTNTTEPRQRRPIDLLKLQGAIDRLGRCISAAEIATLNCIAAACADAPKVLSAIDLACVMGEPQRKVFGAIHGLEHLGFIVRVPPPFGSDGLSTYHVIDHPDPDRPKLKVASPTPILFRRSADARPPETAPPL